MKKLLTARKQKILDTIIKYYLKYGEPVGSKLIASEIGVSSATIRNEMAELTEQGLLEQPHTSAGRIPSGSGFREHIKTKAETDSLDTNVKAYFDERLSSFDPEQLIERATEALAHKYSCIASLPSDENSIIKTIQFVQISRRKAMIILLSSDGTTKNRIFRCDFDLNQEMLRIFFRVFNEQLMGKRLLEVTPSFLQKFSFSLGEMSVLMTSAIVALYEAVTELSKPKVLFKGQTNLYVDTSINTDNLLSLSKLIQTPETVKTALMQIPSKVAVIIGGDNNFPLLNQVSIVSAKYSINAKETGVFAVIGPLRMDYPKIISEVKYVADCVSAALTDFIKDETAK